MIGRRLKYIILCNITSIEKSGKRAKKKPLREFVIANAKPNEVLVKNTPSDHGSYYSCLACH